MQDKLKFRDAIGCGMVSRRNQTDQLALAGKYTWEHWRDGKLLDSGEFPNGITNEGKNDILDVYFSDATATAAASWYISLIVDTGYTGLAAGDTMSSHSGWSEYTSYSQSTRPAWGPGNPASQSITNASPVVFNFTGSAVIKGIFITSVNTKGGTTGKLWSTGLFAADRSVVNGDEIRVNYTLSC